MLTEVCGSIVFVVMRYATFSGQWSPGRWEGGRPRFESLRGTRGGFDTIALLSSRSSKPWSRAGPPSTALKRTADDPRLARRDPKFRGKHRGWTSGGMYDPVAAVPYRASCPRPGGFGKKLLFSSARGLLEGRTIMKG